MNSAEDLSLRLARRLRALRQERWPDKRVTQGELAAALGASVPLISSWESRKNPKPPPIERLEAYATFFASERSVSKHPYRLLAESQLTSEERARRDELLGELTTLRNGTQGQEGAGRADDPFANSHWRFPPRQDITIVGSELPPEYRRKLSPYTDPNAPDFVELYRYPDLDALLELFGHIRAANPRSDVHIRPPSRLERDDITSHLVLLGGVDWNPITRDLLLHHVELGVRQLLRKNEAEPGGFEITDGGKKRLFSPVLRESDGQATLVEDLALFYRAPNPFNDKRTVSICNGSYQRGTYGVVRALTDTRFRDRNDAYLRRRFAGHDAFSIISRVTVLQGEVVTPDWTKSDDLLYEWPV